MYELDKAAFGHFLAQLRREKGMTQKELAATLYVSDKAVSKWECGAGAPDIALLPRLSELLGVDTEALLRGELGENDRSGKNWWCVLYPSLCRAACGSYALPQENDLICGEYIVRFRLVDWVQSVCSDCADRTLLSPAA